MEHLQQIDDKTCGHTCLAMAFGLTVQQVVDELGPQPLGFDKYAQFMVKRAVFPREYRWPDLFHWQGLYIATVPSLNLPGQLHAVLLDVSDQIVVYDPQWGREERRSYAPDSVVNIHMVVCDVIYLDTTLLSEKLLFEEIGVMQREAHWVEEGFLMDTPGQVRLSKLPAGTHLYYRKEK